MLFISIYTYCIFNLYVFVILMYFVWITYIGNNTHMLQVWNIWLHLPKRWDDDMLLESSSISWLVNRAPCNVTLPSPEIRAYENHWFSSRWGLLNPYEDSKKVSRHGQSHSPVLLLSWRPRETSSQFNVSPDSKWWVACWVRWIQVAFLVKIPSIKPQQISADCPMGFITIFAPNLGEYFLDLFQASNMQVFGGHAHSPCPNSSSTIRRRLLLTHI